MNRSDYEQYHKNGGTYIIPVEVFNELFDELDKIKEKEILNDKKAKEMFEEIGYKSISDDKFISWIFKCDEYTKEIAFDFNTERVEFYFYDNKHKELGISLTLEETLAIYKQADELWGHKK